MQLSPAFCVGLLGFFQPSQAREICTILPGDSAAACVVEQGNFQIETTPVRWVRDRDFDIVLDEVALGSTTLRYGLTDTLELDVGWAPFNVSIQTCNATGQRTRISGVGDVSLGVRKSLSSPDGSGIALALQGFVVAPTGRDRIGLGFWLTGLQLPFSAELPGGFSLGLTPGVERVANANGDGRHVGYTGAIRLSHDIGPITARAGFNLLLDDDPDLPFTQASTSLTIAWSPA